MEKSKVDMFLGLNAENFTPQDLMQVKARLEELDDDKFFLIQGGDYQKPSFILLIAILLGWERFWLDDVAMGLLKVITCYGCFVWWIVDIFTAKDRAKSYNFKKFNQTLAYAS